ncbi:hypothetical protein ETAA8_59020 [Anatilimnocola aggregata]|uniref:Uncharacterized protein n=1 Tax=Anatilimnocola aggregata TaxID=2528021 RepID=A0A517YKL0_9BACT|nr:hypothetical protein [Anatilimnocola aggregata]QDU30754.1 hypothetical protein ETAA8_59020 [Anatilimnocola aggregata]
MKKLFALLVIAGLGLSTVGCEPKPAEAPKVETPAVTPEAPVEAPPTTGDTTPPAPEGTPAPAPEATPAPAPEAPAAPAPEEKKE